VPGVPGDNGTNGLNGQDGEILVTIIGENESTIVQFNTSFANLTIIITDNDTFVMMPGPPGPQGPPGLNGTDGVNGTCVPCHNGTNGVNGVNGHNGTNGVNGTCAGQCINPTNALIVVDNTTQDVIATDTWTPINFTLNLVTQGWTHPSGSSNFTATVTARYVCSLNVVVSATGGVANILLIGMPQPLGSGPFNQILGSQVAESLQSSSSSQTMITTFVVTVNATDVISVYFASNRITTNLHPFDIANLTVYPTSAHFQCLELALGP
jgi:hypothetical protein